MQKDIQRAADNGIQLVHLPDEKSFRQALDRDPLVIFVGHANWGNGPVLRSALGHDVLLPIPGAQPAVTPGIDAAQHTAILHEFHQKVEVVEPLTLGKCRMFMYLGCRTELYFGHALSVLNPHTEFVLGWYLWTAPDFMVEGLQKGHTPQIMRSLQDWECSDLNLLQPVEIFGVAVIENGNQKLVASFQDLVVNRIAEAPADRLVTMHKRQQSSTLTGNPA